MTERRTDRPPTSRVSGSVLQGTVELGRDGDGAPRWRQTRSRDWIAGDEKFEARIPEGSFKWGFPSHHVTAGVAQLLQGRSIVTLQPSSCACVMTTCLIYSTGKQFHFRYHQETRRKQQHFGPPPLDD
uniref:(California timema) hypothetical protein n=1 Tax=Timema californicum TaxID=61474 RepID=A0A7R9J4W7_TIMCA|nr:unnamed protein product [Timema californicum]